MSLKYKKLKKVNECIEDAKNAPLMRKQEHLERAFGWLVDTLADYENRIIALEGELNID